MQLRYDTYSALIEPWATTEVAGYSFLRNTSDFYNAVAELKTHAADRDAAVDAYLSQQ